MNTPQSPGPRPSLRRHLRAGLAWLALSLVLSAVFLAYNQPALMQQLSEQLWACF